MNPAQKSQLASPHTGVGKGTLSEPEPWAVWTRGDQGGAVQQEDCGQIPTSSESGDGTSWPFPPCSPLTALAGLPLAEPHWMACGKEAWDMCFAKDRPQPSRAGREIGQMTSKSSQGYNSRPHLQGDISGSCFCFFNFGCCSVLTFLL